MILRHTYVRGAGGAAAVARARGTARAAVRYYQMRPRGEDEPARGLFTKEGGVARDEAYRLLDDYQARGYLVHRLVLSPAEDETPADLRAMTREALRRLEADKGLGLHWVAVAHRHTAHPHVHVVIAGGGERAGADGGPLVEVRLDRADHARLKAAAGDYCRDEGREREGWDRALDAAARDAAGARERDRARGRDRADWTP